LKKEATKPASANFLQQQARFDKFIEVFNNERPHEALDMKCPEEVYQPSLRPYSGLPMWAHLSGQEENQFQSGLCRPSGGRQRSPRRYLVGELYGL
jgi:hypothetical protein